MNHVRILLLLCLMLPACASTAERKRASRAHRYNATLAQLKWGATRADLQRFFPSPGPARPFPTSILALPGPGFKPELYPLDADFAVPVTYYYRRSQVQRSAPAHHAAASHRQPLSSDAIDDLLFGGHLFRIYPQPADRIASFPLRVQPRSTAVPNSNCED